MPARFIFFLDDKAALLAHVSDPEYLVLAPLHATRLQYSVKFMERIPPS
jgi:hypothetical protein